MSSFFNLLAIGLNDAKVNKPEGSAETIGIPLIKNFSTVLSVGDFFPKYSSIPLSSNPSNKNFRKMQMGDTVVVAAGDERGH